MASEAHGRARDRALPSAPRSVLAAFALVMLVVATGPRSASAQRVPFGVPLEARGFERLTRKGPVAVYQNRASPIIEIAAEGRLPFPPDAVAAALLDYERQVGTVARLSEIRLLRRGARSLQVYQRLNLPVIDDRDYALHVSWGRESEVVWITFRALPPNTVPRRRGVVRVTRHEGSWQLKPVAGGKATLVRFSTAMDMGGLIPRWLVRPGSLKELPRLFASIDALVRRGNARRLAWSTSSK